MRYDSLLDAPVALGSMPERIRQRIGISTTWKTDHRHSWVGAAVGLTFNSFRYSPRGSLHATLVHAAGLLDHNWSILFMLRPEPGADGRPGSISTSIGLLAAEFRVPVVPVGVTGLPGAGSRWRVSRRCGVTVRFAEPLFQEAGMSYQSVEMAVERVVQGTYPWGPIGVHGGTRGAIASVDVDGHAVLSDGAAPQREAGTRVPAGEGRAGLRESID